MTGKGRTLKKSAQVCDIIENRDVSSSYTLPSGGDCQDTSRNTCLKTAGGVIDGEAEEKEHAKKTELLARICDSVGKG